LAARPGWRVAGLVDRLRDETRRLDELSHRGWTLRASIAPTYPTLTADARLLFRLLALLEAPAHHTWTAAALLDTTLADAEAALEALVDARLVDAVEAQETGRRHYRMPDLGRLYAREFPTDPGALARVFGGWLSLVDAAHREEYGGDHANLHSTAPRWCPPDGDPSRYIGAGEALSWWDASRAALVATIRQAARAGFVAHSWDLALTCVTLFEVRAYFDDWKVTTTLAHNAATAAGDLAGEAAMRYSLGTWCMAQSRFAEATHWFTQAEDAFTTTGNAHGVALTLRNAAHVDGAQGRDALMLSKYAKALATMREVGDLVGEAHILRAQARHFLTQGNVATARPLLTDSLTLSRETHCRRTESQTLLTLAELHLAVAEFDKSREHLHTVLRIVRAAADRPGEAHALYVLGLLRHREGRPTPATKTLTDALELSKRVRDRQVEAKSHYALGELALSRKDFSAATAHLDAARAVFAELNSLACQRKAEALLAEARSGLTPPQEVPAEERPSADERPYEAA
jgi:tetratricopeptide (TPR) repeat protein